MEYSPGNGARKTCDAVSLKRRGWSTLLAENQPRGQVMCGRGYWKRMGVLIGLLVAFAPMGCAKQGADSPPPQEQKGDPASDERGQMEAPATPGQDKTTAPLPTPDQASPAPAEAPPAPVAAAPAKAAPKVPIQKGPSPGCGKAVEIEKARLAKLERGMALLESNKAHHRALGQRHDRLKPALAAMKARIQSCEQSSARPVPQCVAIASGKVAECDGLKEGAQREACRALVTLVTAIREADESLCQGGPLPEVTPLCRGAVSGTFDCPADAQGAFVEGCRLLAAGVDVARCGASGESEEACRVARLIAALGAGSPALCRYLDDSPRRDCEAFFAKDTSVCKAVPSDVPECREVIVAEVFTPPAEGSSAAGRVALDVINLYGLHGVVSCTCSVRLFDGQALVEEAEVRVEKLAAEEWVKSVSVQVKAAAPGLRLETSSACEWTL